MLKSEDTVSSMKNKLPPPPRLVVQYQVTSAEVIHIKVIFLVQGFICVYVCLNIYYEYEFERE